jgi:hypothetical protein
MLSMFLGTFVVHQRLLLVREEQDLELHVDRADDHHLALHIVKMRA